MTVSLNMPRLMLGFILAICFGIISAEIDCSLNPTGESGVDSCYFVGSSGINIYCYYPYTCCDGTATNSANGCCFDKSGSYWFTTVELLGVILNATAIFFVAILTLIICGATYCNDKEDASHIFMSNRK